MKKMIFENSQSINKKIQVVENANHHQIQRQEDKTRT